MPLQQCSYMFQMTYIWYQMKCECYYINHISAKLKQNDHPLTNYVHFSDTSILVTLPSPPRQMYVITKK